MIVDHELFQILEGVVISFSDINPRFVKNIHVTYACGMVANYRLDEFRAIAHEVTDEDEVNVDLRYDAITSIVNETVERLDTKLRLSRENRICNRRRLKEQRNRT